MIVSNEGFDDESKLLRTVFVGNLPLKVKKKALAKEFSQFGEIESVRIRSIPLANFSVECLICLSEMKEAKAVKFNLHQHPEHQNGHLAPFKLAKLFDPEASWDKDQLGDVLHWIRQSVALVFGLLWGSIPLVGGIWFIT